MGRRSRRRNAIDAETLPTPVVRDHQARVKVSDDVWRDFRLAIGYRSVAEVLGELVRREVDRDRAARVREGSANEQQLLAALDRASELRADLALIVRSLERRLGQSSDHGR